MAKAKKRILERRGVAVALFIALVAVVTIVGLYAIGEKPMGTIVSNFGPPGGKPKSSPSSYSFDASEYVEEEWKSLRSAGLKRVTKFIKDGSIQRINEAKRQLFVNDAVWHGLGRDRQEHIVRVVVGYLDVVNENNPGTIGVYSFRNGRVIAEMKKGGTYTVFM